MGALQPWHLVIIVFIILLLFGSTRLPALSRSLGQSIRGFKKGLHEDQGDEDTKKPPADGSSKAS